MINNKSKSNHILIILTLVLLILFCIAAVITRAIDFFDMPASFLGAALGAVITAIVTLLLLERQAKTAEETERNVKIFELKKEAFTSYINKVWKTWSDQRIEYCEFEELCSSFYKDIAMFLKKPDKQKNSIKPVEDKSKDFVDCLIKIGECLGETSEKNHGIIEENVFKIINILVEDLGMAGSVSQEQYDHLAKTLLPGFFKAAVEKEIFNVMQGMSKGFLPGKFEPFYYDNEEYLSFYCDTEKIAGANFAKVIIGPFKDSGQGNDGQTKWPDRDVGVYFCTDINWNSWRPNENMPILGIYKAGKAKEWYRIIRTKEIIKDSNISCPIKRTDDKEVDDKGVYHINFGDINSLAKYRVNYPEVAKVLAKRVRIFFDEERIDLKDLEGNPTGEAVSIIEFMRLYKLIE